MPTVEVRYFGRLRELLDVKKEEYTVEDGATLTNLLLNHIPERHREASHKWNETIFRTVKGEIALNKDGTPVLANHLVLIGGRSPSLTYKLKAGDEIAVLPPFGGG
ncbi:MAG: MoaD/ThiS family protein [Candidatus Bathyarchaeota archaeon]|nr:MoaD/ThiS family protein [Candidatus Bathyarchaeota archaeon]